MTRRGLRGDLGTASRTTLAAGLCLILASAALPARAMSIQEICAQSYKIAKKSNTLNGVGWSTYYATCKREHTLHPTPGRAASASSTHSQPSH